MRYATADEVMTAIAHRDPDSNNVWPAEWLDNFTRYDVCAELIVEICKQRKNPAFSELVDILTVCIDTHQDDRANGLI